MADATSHRRVRRLFSILAGLFLGLIILWSAGIRCSSPILVGFAAELTGKQSNLGVQARNGAQLAVETINAAGGVAGRPLELVIRDDGGTLQGALAADQALIDAGVVAIIGHITSAQSLSAYPLIQEQKVILLSPTTATALLEGIDDYFFRVMPVNTEEARILAAHIMADHSPGSVSAIYDLDNAAYAAVLWENFVEIYRSLGGTTHDPVTFFSSGEPDFVPLVTRLISTQPDVVLVIGSSIDTALIIQQIRQSGWDGSIFVSLWAHTNTFIRNGGRAIEEVELVTPYDADNDSVMHRDFVARYEARFNRLPNFAAAFAYDAVLTLAAALEETSGSAEGLREALLNIRGLQGLTSTMTFDAYGDIIRSQFLVVVRDGEFVTLERLHRE